MRRLFAAACFASLLLLGAIPCAGAGASRFSGAFETQLAAGRAVDVIVEFDGAAADREARDSRTRRRLQLDDATIIAARAVRYQATKSDVERSVKGADAAPVRDFPHLPLAVWHLNSVAALDRLRGHPALRGIYNIRQVHAVATPSDLAMIEQPATAAAGGTGTNTTVVVIDDGIDLTNPAFGTCPSAGAPGCRVIYDKDYYPGTTPDETHGTNVSGIVAEVAPGARLAMHNVFNGANAYSTDIISALDWAYGNQAKYNVTAANMSLGSSTTYAPGSCPADLNSTTTLLATAGITLVAAAGNNAATGSLALPACTPGIVSVGAVYDTALVGSSNWGGICAVADTNPTADQIACFSDVASNLTLLAPGINVTAAGITYSGTSQASPHAAGAITVLRARYPAESLSQTLLRLTSTGKLDTRGTFSIPRIDLFKSFDLGTALALTASGPATATAGTNASYTLTVTNSGPLVATRVTVTDVLPALATFVSASPSGCSASGATVTCLVTSLAVNASTQFTITVQFTGSGPAYDTASASADQIDSTPNQSSVALGTAPPPPAEVPDYSGPALPPWAAALLAAALLVGLRRAQRAR